MRLFGLRTADYRLRATPAKNVELEYESHHEHEYDLRTMWTRNYGLRTRNYDCTNYIAPVGRTGEGRLSYRTADLAQGGLEIVVGALELIGVDHERRAEHDQRRAVPRAVDRLAIESPPTACTGIDTARTISSSSSSGLRPLTSRRSSKPM